MICGVVFNNYTCDSTCSRNIDLRRAGYHDHDFATVSIESCSYLFGLTITKGRLQFGTRCASRTVLSLECYMGLSKITGAVKGRFATALLKGESVLFFGDFIICVERIGVVRLRATRLLRLLFCSATRFGYGTRGFLGLFLYGFAVKVSRLGGAACRFTGYCYVTLVRIFTGSRVSVGGVAMLLLTGFASGFYRMIKCGTMVIYGIFKTRF